MPDQDLPPERQPPFSELQGLLAQAWQQGQQYRVGLIVAIVVALLFLSSS